MSDMKWTKGPWRTQTGFRNKNMCILGPNTEEIAVVELLREDARANGRLIAAAPEMVELLKRLRAKTAGQSTSPVWYREIDALLARVEGK